ncbi:MAG: hypothetical protein WBA63_01665 [Thermomicrobiales bacterium]
MRSDRAHPREIDALDALWDSLNQEESRLPRIPEGQDGDSALSIALLQSLAAQEFDMPTTVGSSDRVRARFDAITGKDGPMASVHAPTIPAANRPRLPRHRVLHQHDLPTSALFGRLAATILLLVVLASATAIGPGRGMLPGNVERQLAALPGFESSKPKQKPQGDRSLMSIRLIPDASPTGRIEVGLWRVTLAPGTTLRVPETIHTLGQDPVSQFVESGSITLGGQGKEFTATADHNMGIQAVEYYRNDSVQPAEMLLLAPMGENGAFPLVTSSHRDASTPSAAMEPTAILLGTNSISADDGYQIRVTLSTLHYADMLDQQHYRAGSPAYALIEQGEVTVNRAATDGTPASSEVYGAGETIRLDGNRRLNATFTESGSEPLSALIVETAPMSDNPTLDQTQKAAAPLFIDWTVPAPGDITLTFRTLTVGPGGTYAMPTDAGVSYALISGNVDLSVDGGEATPLQPGAVVGQEPGTTLAFTNSGTKPVRLIQSVVSASDDVTNWPGEQSTNTDTQIVVTAGETLPPGPVSIMLESREFEGDNGARSSSQDGIGITLAIAAEGTVNVSRLGGDVQIVPDNASTSGTPPVGTPVVSQGNRAATPASDAAQPPLGENMPISDGNGYMIAHPGSGWSMSGNGDSPSIGIALTVSPSDFGNATPEAMSGTPASDGPTIMLRGDAAACSIAPLTADRLDQIMATPVAETSPLDRSLKNQPGGSADAATTDEITAMLQSYVDCTAAGDYTRIYAFYSGQALRENEAAIDLVERDWQVGERPVQASVEDIVRFGDGRAGARAVIDGEATHLTFVQEDGIWKIDVWDDRND